VDGEVVITGKLKDSLVIDGRHFAPQDIELAIEGADPAIADGCCAAFGTNIDGKERLIVLVGIDERARKSQQFEAERLISTLRTLIRQEFGLESYDVVLVKARSIFKTSSGKLRRNACRDAYLSLAASRWNQSQDSSGRTKMLSRRTLRWQPGSKRLCTRPRRMQTRIAKQRELRENNPRRKLTITSQSLV
jgi:acyl-CoA synthetase (AMP-forming)/AMP-acid ligase II